MRNVLPIQWALPPSHPSPINPTIQGRPYFPNDNGVIMRAQSLLTGSLIGGQCPPLTKDQALDVIRWAGEKV